jgi:hypothetical protein
MNTSLRLDRERAEAQRYVEAICSDLDGLLEAYSTVLDPLQTTRVVRALDALEYVYASLENEEGDV